MAKFAAGLGDVKGQGDGGVQCLLSGISAPSKTGPTR